MPWRLQAQSFQCGPRDTFSDMHTRSQEELRMDAYISPSMPDYTNLCVETTQLCTLSHSPSLHLKHACSFSVVPTLSLPRLSISCFHLGSVSAFLAFSFTSSHPSCSYSPSHSLLGLFFFELHSAYSRAYNLTPPSSLTLSLYPLAKLPFRSRGNPLISLT